MSAEELGKKSLRVHCSICDKEWFQTSERLLLTDNQHILEAMTEEKVNEVKKIIAEKNWPKYPRVDKIGIFVGNLPYTYEEKDLGDLFGEYGLTGITLVRDAEGRSKGFAFLEVSNEEDAQLMIKEMHHFYTDAQRKLTVRMVSTWKYSDQPLCSNTITTLSYAHSLSLCFCT
jgi:hypothetical protein